MTFNQAKEQANWSLFGTDRAIFRAAWGSPPKAVVYPTHPGLLIGSHYKDEAGAPYALSFEDFTAADWELAPVHP